MPAYDYRCVDGCPSWEEVWYPTIPQEKPIPPLCKEHGEMFRDFHSEHHGHIPGGTYPFMHPHITGDGTPVEIRSDAHYREVLREYSLKRSIAAYGEKGADPEFMKARPDAGFVDDRVEMGPDGNRMVIPGTGLGNPRSWVSVPPLATASREEIEAFFTRG